MMRTCWRSTWMPFPDGVYAKLAKLMLLKLRKSGAKQLKADDI